LVIKVQGSLRFGLVEAVEGLVEGFNHGFANKLGQGAGIAPDGMATAASPTVVDNVALKEAVAPRARQHTGFLVDMARAEALDALGENRAAVVVVERHV
jgi:hypothetical protein